jgi:RNA polymerase sigma-70 factor, ECF subfamily
MNPLASSGVVVVEGTGLDQELVKGVLARDAQAFGLLVERHGPAVRGHLLRILRDEAAADDLLQEVLLRLWERARQWNGQAPLRNWLLRTATNLAVNHLRSARRRRQRPLEPPAPADAEEAADTVPGWMVDASALGPDEVVQEAEQRQILGRLVESLSEEKREVLRMVHEEQMDQVRAAEALGIPLGTVKSRLHHAVRELAEKWKQSHEGENPNER